MKNSASEGYDTYNDTDSALTLIWHDMVEFIVC